MSLVRWEGSPCGPCRKGKKTWTRYHRDRLFKNLSALSDDSLLSRSQPLVPKTEPSIIRGDSDELLSESHSEEHEDKSVTKPKACRRCYQPMLRRTRSRHLLFGMNIKQKGVEILGDQLAYNKYTHFWRRALELSTMPTAAP
jgi:hypothetical protein